MRYSVIFFSSFPLTLISNANAAQQPTRLPKVVVQSIPLPQLEPLENADVIRITAKDLERQQAVTLADALRCLPGSYVIQNGGVGQETRVSLRGVGGANTTIIVNGMPIHDAGAFDEAVNLSRWALDDVAEIQVVQGPMSSLYGSGGMGGAILIETKKGSGAHKTFAKAEGGSFHTFSQMVGVQGQRDLMDYHVVGSRLQSAGTSTTPGRFLSQIQEKPNNPLHQETIAARLGAGAESAYVSFFSQYGTRRFGFRQAPNDPYPWRQNFSDIFNRLQGHFEDAAGRWRHDIGLGYYQNELTNTSSRQSPIVRNGSQLQVDYRQAYDVTDRLQGQMAMDCGQEKLYWRKVPSTNATFKTLHGGLSATLSYKPYEALMITGSSRVDKYQGVPLTATYRLGGRYVFEKMTIKGGLGTAFKAPTLQQKFYKTPSLSGNPTLKPERSFGGDLGVERPFFQGRLTVGVTLFQNRIRDLITGSLDRTTLVNMNKSRTQGVEGLLRFRLTPDWALELSHTYTQAWDEKTGAGLLGVPRNKTVFCMKGQVTPEWYMSATILYISPRMTNDAVTFRSARTPSYTIIGAETAYQLADGWQIYGRGENLLNRRYENPRSAQQPGIGLYGGVRAQW
jgi:vitamin B12 transporter